MFNSIYSTIVSLAGVVSGHSGTMSHWNKRVPFLIPRRRFWHPQPPLQSQPTSLASDSMSSQPVAVMNIEWDYNYYQPWSDNEWLVDEILAMLDKDVTMQ